MSTKEDLNCAETAAIVIQRWFRIRKRKTLFELLSIYSFSKRLELVSLCQQVHMYNQEFYFQLQKKDAIVQPEYICSLEDERLSEKSNLSNNLNIDTIGNQETFEPAIEFQSEDFAHVNCSLADMECDDSGDLSSNAEQQSDEILGLQEFTPTRDIGSSNETLPSTSSAGIGVIDELTMRATLAKNISRKDPNTDAPYNFQALLRKTKYSDRNSLRRMPDVLCSETSDGVTSGVTTLATSNQFTDMEPELFDVISRHQIMPGFAVIGQCAEW